MPAKDAHHILERRLFADGGYYLDNGASLCERHHLDAEMTQLSCEAIREAAHITRVVLPEHLYCDQRYDKWGNPILPSGRRLVGELMSDPSVRKVLEAGGVLGAFTSRVKYPRTYHLPWSPGVVKDDRLLPSLAGFEGEDVVVTIKMDGENTTMYRDGMHARSIEYESHPSRSYVKAMHARVAHEIPEGWRVCGENLFAQHSIRYEALPGYFLVFSVWNAENQCLSWDETVEWAALLGFTTVPVAWRGPWSSSTREAKLEKLARSTGERMEGYVVRVARAFRYGDFRRFVGKYVRAGHVTTHDRWMHGPVVPNGLAGG
ncbi:MAG TPA: RNA ligase family protein [Planctomycetota bacterium]|nr:RNA ligase family protein [Planctomycetota bacterium]